MNTCNRKYCVTNKKKLEEEMSKFNFYINFQS